MQRNRNPKVGQEEGRVRLHLYRHWRYTRLAFPFEVDDNDENRALLALQLEISSSSLRGGSIPSNR